MGSKILNFFKFLGDIYAAGRRNQKQTTKFQRKKEKCPCQSYWLWSYWLTIPVFTPDDICMAQKPARWTSYHKVAPTLLFTTVYCLLQLYCAPGHKANTKVNLLRRNTLSIHISCKSHKESGRIFKKRAITNKSQQNQQTTQLCNQSIKTPYTEFSIRHLNIFKENKMSNKLIWKTWLETSIMAQCVKAPVWVPGWSTSEPASC